MEKNKIFFWSPRILAIIYILFISIFSLDSKSILEWIIHMIPSFILIAITAIAWKWEKIGGILFIILGIAFTLFFHTYKHIIGFTMISIPVFLIGTVFITHAYKKNHL